ncbi:MAG: 50S ribosomal protein L4 [Candidatus Bathyarchaeia archaeon]
MSGCSTMALEEKAEGELGSPEEGSKEGKEAVREAIQVSGKDEVEGEGVGIGIDKGKSEGEDMKNKEEGVEKEGPYEKGTIEPLPRTRAPRERRPTVRVYNLDGKVVGRIRLPQIFRIPIRPDLIRRVVVALQSHRFQRKGRNPKAGMRTSAESVGVGRGLARVPRIHDSTRAAFAPMTVGGRLAHPPRAEKILAKKVNKKERLLALASAVAATGSLELVTKRGHVASLKGLPLVVSDELQSLNKAKDVERSLKSLGLWDDVLRVKGRIKERSRGARSRGRSRRVGKGPLIVVAEDKGIMKAARNIPGLEIVRLQDLNVELLAPGGTPGRLTLWDSSSFKTIDQLFHGVMA